MTVTWIDGFTATINNGTKIMFRGIIRGQSLPPITYIADTMSDLLDGLNLDEWIYYIEEIEEVE